MIVATEHLRKFGQLFCRVAEHGRTRPEQVVTSRKLRGRWRKIAISLIDRGLASKRRKLV